MDSRLLHVKAITLTYRESTLKSKSDMSAPLIRDALAIIDTAEDKVARGDFTGTDPLVELRKTLNKILSHNGDEPIDKNDLLQRLLVNTDGDDVLYSALKDGIEADMSEQECTIYCRNQIGEIKEFIDTQRALSFIKTAFYMLRTSRNDTSPGNIINDMMTRLEPYRNIGASTSTKTRGYSEVDIFDHGSMTEVFKNVRIAQAGLGGLQTGMQGLNLMAGPTKKFTMGETLFVPGSSFSYKTGTSKAIIRQLAMHNTPTMRDPNKIPLLVFWSVENETYTTLRDIYRACWYLEHRDASGFDAMEDEAVEDIYQKHIEGLSDDDMGAYVKANLGRNGYHVKFIRSNPAETDYLEIINRCDEWKRAGYELHGFVLDYMEKLNTRGCAQGVAGADIKDLLSRLRNFFSVEGSLFWTPHQLNGEARIRRDNGEKNWIQKMGGSGTHYARCKDLYQEIDVEIVVNCFMYNTVKHLEYYLGKNRNNPAVPEGRKHAMYRLCPFTGLRDDIDREDSKIKKLGGGGMGGDAMAW